MIQFHGWEDQKCQKRGSYHSYLFVRGGRSLFTLPKIYHVHLPVNFPTNISFSTFLSNFKLNYFWLPFCSPKIHIFLLSCFHPTLEGRFGFWHIRPAGTTPKRPSPCCNVPRRVTGIARSWTFSDTQKDAMFEAGKCNFHTIFFCWHDFPWNRTEILDLNISLPPRIVLQALFVRGFGC